MKKREMIKSIWTNCLDALLCSKVPQNRGICGENIQNVEEIFI